MRVAVPNGRRLHARQCVHHPHLPTQATVSSSTPMTQVLSEADYDALAAPELQRLITSLDAFTERSDESLEAELASDILTIEFSDGTRYVLNSHRAARQIWLSADRSAWHFDYVPGSKTWVAAKSGDEMWATLNRLLSAKLKTPVELRYEPVPRATRASPP